jgi:cysteine protease ATG4
VEELMTRDSKTIIERRRAKLEKESTPTHPLDNAWECELLELESNVRWDTALLLFIPLRLGLKAFNQDYVQALAHVFSLQQSVGVLGGRPRGARWFYGAVADGSKIFGLDPHTVQPAPRKRTAMVNGVLSHAVELSDDYMRSVHTNYPEAFCLSKMDPSIALGFYCKDRDDFLDLILSLEEWKQEHPDLPELFCVSEAAPDYSANVSSVMDDMLGSQTMNGSLMDDDESVVSDEDEYVVL